MWSNFGRSCNVNIFGESHGSAIGVTITGLPAGFQLDFSEIRLQMARRAPGGSLATPRREPDDPEILSGLSQNGVTTGAPLTAVIRNVNQHSSDYQALKDRPRPAHADLPAHIKFGGHADLRGGGHFSGRLTAPLCFAGSVVRQILQIKHGIALFGHIRSIGGAEDLPLAEPPAGDVIRRLQTSSFSLLSPGAISAMRAEIEAARNAGDSVGGTVELMATGIPAGIGSPIFGGVENILSAALFGVPGIKGVAFGGGFDLANARGSAVNDAFCWQDGKVISKTNHAGGILGGMTTGMPLRITAAFKPTPSIAQPQQTVDLAEKTDTSIEIKGRHDPCIVPRGLPAAEAAVAVGLLELLKEAGQL